MSLRQLRQRVHALGYCVSAPAQREAAGLWMIEIRRGMTTAAVLWLDANPDEGRSQSCALNLPTLYRVERLANSRECGLLRGLRRIVELESELSSGPRALLRQSPSISG